ncbi:MAG: hypothetical protein IJU40_06440 [Desulfovibrionaceae bacterium]|nr:hypothetical protein [Desulfovibrionaceae bacterium]
MESKISDQNFLDQLFPKERTEQFFEALFGGAEEGAYDIRLSFRRADQNKLEMAFDLLQRPGKCLRCNLTYGLPKVFERHPVLKVAKVAEDLAKICGWEKMHWSLGTTEEYTQEHHAIPFTIIKDA